MNYVTKLLKSSQSSACDGELLRIKCNEEYVIEVLAAEHTILPEKVNQNETKVSKAAELVAAQAQLGGSQAEDNDESKRPIQICPAGGSWNRRSQDSFGQSGAKVCDQQQSVSSALNRDTIYSLVRAECQSRNSCLLDLRWPRANSSEAPTLVANSAPTSTNSTSSNANTITSTNTNSQPQFQGLKANGLKLSRLFNEPCPLNRKLVEIVYKCRPAKASRKTICRGAQLSLECPSEKRLMVSLAEYGASANDSKTIARCQAEWEQRSSSATSEPVAGPAEHQSTVASSPGSSLAPPPPQQLNQSCLANSTQATGVLVSKCLFQQRCQLEVEPSVFGEPNCPAGHPQYLRFVFACINSSLLLESHFYLELTGKQAARQQSPQPFTSSNISSSSLLSSLASSQATSARPSTQLTWLTASSAPPADAPPDWTGEASQQADSGARLYTLATGGEVSAPGPHGWTVGQRARLLLLRYQSQVLALAMLSLSMLVFAFALRSCRSAKLAADSRNSTASSSSTKSSSGSKSLASSSSSATTNSSGLNQSQANANKLKHGSCSESCFSLDDYNLTGAHCASNSNSPALASSNTPLECAHEGQAFAQTSLRPKLWTVYNNEPNSLRAAAHNNTMRPTRTFVGQQQQQQQHQQARTGHCLHNAPARGSLSNAADLLLALAGSQAPRAPTWCPSGEPLNQQHSPTDRLALLINPPNGAPHLASAAAAPANQCAYHQSQAQYQQQQQQQLLFAPPAIQLELPQVQLANVQQQQQQQQLQQANNNQQQATTARQFSTNFGSISQA